MCGLWMKWPGSDCGGGGGLYGVGEGAAGYVNQYLGIISISPHGGKMQFRYKNQQSSKYRRVTFI